MIGHRPFVITLGNLPWKSQLILEGGIRPVANCNLPVTPEEVCDHLEGFADRTDCVVRVKDSNRIILCVPENMHGRYTGVIATRLRRLHGISEVMVGTFNGSLKIGDFVVETPESSDSVEVVIGCGDVRSTAGIRKVINKPTSVFRFVGAGLGEDPSEDTQAGTFSRFVLSRALAFKRQGDPIIVTHDGCAGFRQGSNRRRIKRIARLVPAVCENPGCVVHHHVSNNGAVLKTTPLSF